MSEFQDPSPAVQPVTRRARRAVGWMVALVLVLLALVVAGVFIGPALVRLAVPPAPTLPAGFVDETSPAQMTTQRTQATERLNSTGWVDQEAGVAHIPINQAMALLAATGLPVATEPTATPVQEQPADTSVDLADLNYVDNILPIFEQHCAECHGAEDPEEGLEVTRYQALMAGSIYGAVVKPGDPDNSYLVEMIATGKMPKKGEPLTQTELDTIVAWIAAGAPEEGASDPTAAVNITDTTTITGPAQTEAAAIDPALVSFQHDVLPIFEQHCAECHGADDPEEGLELTRYQTLMAGSVYGSVVKPGEPENSYLVEMITSGKMPKKGDPLTQTEIDTIVAWIAAGAADN